MNTKLTVIIPIYNGEEFLHRCLDSVIYQTFQDMEVILVDNKSTDSTGAICDEYSEKDSRIRVIHRKEHGWISDGRDDGLAVASGEWITFVDADDFLEPEFYKEMFSRMPKDRETIDIFFSGGKYWHLASGKIQINKGLGTFDYTEKDKMMELIRLLIDLKALSKDMATLSFVWDKFYRADFLRKNQLYFPKDVLCADDIYFNLLAFEKAARIAGTDYIGYHYWYNPISISNKYRPDYPDVRTHFAEQMKNSLVREEIYSQMEENINRFIMRQLWMIAKRGCFHRDNKTNYAQRKKEFNELKRLDIYHHAIYGNIGNSFSKYKLWALLLRTPICFPMEIYIKVKG